MKKLLSLLTAAVLSASSIASTTAFTTKTKQNIQSNNYLKQEFTNTESVKLISKYYLNYIENGYEQDLFTVNLQISLNKWNILWSAQKGWSHFFSRMYSHIGVYHSELGREAGEQTIKYQNKYTTGYIFDKNTLNAKDDMTAVYSIFAWSYWGGHYSENNRFMTAIDQDYYNNGYHGTYVSTLINHANALPTETSLLTFNVTFRLNTLNNQSFQTLTI